MNNLFSYSAVIICGFALIYLFWCLFWKGWKKERGGLVEFTPITEYETLIPVMGAITEQGLIYKKMAFIYNRLSPCPAYYKTRMCMLTKLICDYAECYKLIIKSPKDYEKIFNEVDNLEQLNLYLDGKGNKEKAVNEVYEYFEGLNEKRH